MRVTFIANPRAGRGRTGAFFTAFSRDAGRLGHDARMLWTEAPGHATELARAARGECDVVCVVGGDGTVHEVVNGLMPEPVPVVIVPVGSGNDFAGLVGCPRTHEELESVLATGWGVRVDVLECGARYCVNSAGLGFEALVTKKSLSIDHLRGLPLYLTAVFKALVSFDCPPMTIRCEGEADVTGERLLVSVANGVSAGGGFRLTPNSYPDDGLIDLCVVERMGRARILLLLPTAIRGGHTQKRGVTMMRTRDVTITAERAFHVHIDGEYLGEEMGPLRFRVLPRALPVLCAKDLPTRTLHGVARIL
jgi:YegS/Rv2252/BmrU family lipid kinase